MRHGLQVFVGGENPLRADQSTDLKDEREEGGKINSAQRAQEKPARNQAVVRAMLRVEQPSDGMGKPVHCVPNYSDGNERTER